MNVVNLQEWKDKKQGKARNESSLVQAMRDSLNNEKVKQSYKIKEPTLEERTERIKQSVKRINQLMDELKNR